MTPTVKVRDPAERVGVDGAWSTTSVKVAWAAVPTEFVAVIVTWWMPAVPVGLPEMVRAPAVKCRPEGRAPDSASVGAGKPVEEKVAEPVVPTLKVSDPAERVGVDGAWSTVTVTVDVAAGVIPLAALMLIG